MPRYLCNSPGGTSFIGPGAGAAPGAGCGNAVDAAVWNVTLPSTFWMIWWMCPLSTVTAEALQVSERAAGVRGAPAPLLVDRPQWQVGHQHDRRARGTAGNILLQPFELLVANLGEAGGFEAGLK